MTRLLTICEEDGERQEAVRLDVLWSGASRETVMLKGMVGVRRIKDPVSNDREDLRCGLCDGWNRVGDHIRAIDEVIWVVAHYS